MTRRLKVLATVLLCAAASFVLLPEAWSQADTALVTRLSRIFNPGGVSDLQFDTDRAAADGSEATLTSVGNFRFLGLLEIGGISTGASCLSRDTAPTPDKIFYDWNCDTFKNTTGGTDCYIADECGVGGGGGGSFSALTSGTNTTATMTVGSNASIVANGTGEIIATHVDAVGAGTIGIGSPDVVNLTLTTDFPISVTEPDLAIIDDGLIASSEITNDTITAADLNQLLTLSNGDLFDFGTNISSSTEGILLPGNATSCTTATGEGQVCWEQDAQHLWVGTGGSVVDIGPNAGGSGDITDVFNCPTGNCQSLIMPTGSYLHGATYSSTINYAAGILAPTATDCSTGTAEGQMCWDRDLDAFWVGTGAGVSLIFGDGYATVHSYNWDPALMLPDGTLCAAPAAVQINSGPVLKSIVCALNNGSTIYGSVVMPDGWEVYTPITFELTYIQTAANTGSMLSDIAYQCRGNGEAPSSTWSAEVAIDDPAVVGSNSNDQATTAGIDVSGSCVNGDVLYWRWQLDAASTVAVGTLHFTNMKLEYGTYLSGD